MRTIERGKSLVHPKLRCSAIGLVVYPSFKLLMNEFFCSVTEALCPVESHRYWEF